MEDGQRARLLLSGLGRNFVPEVSLSRMGRELGSRFRDWAETSFEKSSLSRWAETSGLVVVTGQKLLSRSFRCRDGQRPRSRCRDLKPLVRLLGQ